MATRNPGPIVFRARPDIRRQVYRRAIRLRWRRRAALAAAAVAMMPAAVGAIALLRGPEAQVDVVAATPTTQVAPPPPNPQQLELGSTGLTIRQVDTTDFPIVEVTAMTTGERGLVTLAENGRPVAATVEPLDRPKGIALVVDASGSMSQANKLESVKQAIRQFVSQKRPLDQIAIVGFNNRAEVIQGLTADGDKLAQSVDRLRPTNETAMWDGVNTGLRMLAQSPTDLQANVVLITDGRDTVSSSDFVTARAGAHSADAAVFSIGIDGAELDRDPLRTLAAATGGTFLSGAPDDLSGLLAGVARTLSGQHHIRYRSRAIGAIDLELREGARRVRLDGVPVGSIVDATHRPEVVATRAPRLLETSHARWVISLFVLLGVVLLAYGVFGLSEKSKRQAQRGAIE